MLLLQAGGLLRAPVEDAQRRYNTTVEKYGAGSEQAKAAAEDLKIAQERYNVAVERADMLQGNFNETIVRSALQIMPTAVTMVDSFGKVWKNIPDMSGALSKLSAGIGDVGISAKTAAIGVAGFVGGFLAGDAILKAVPENMRGIASALMAGIAAIVAATVAWMAFQGTMTVGVAVPIILAAVGAGIAGAQYHCQRLCRRGFLARLPFKRRGEISAGGKIRGRIFTPRLAGALG